MRQRTLFYNDAWVDFHEVLAVSEPKCELLRYDKIGDLQKFGSQMRNWRYYCSPISVERNWFNNPYVLKGYLDHDPTVKYIYSFIKAVTLVLWKFTGYEVGCLTFKCVLDTILAFTPYDPYHRTFTHTITMWGAKMFIISYQRQMMRNLECEREADLWPAYKHDNQILLENFELQSKLVHTIEKEKRLVYLESKLLITRTHIPAKRRRK